MRSAVAALASTLALLTGTAAFAQDPAAGEALFNQATALLGEGRTDEACAAFAASYKADATLGTLLNLANCHQKQGKLATAWAEFREVERKAAGAGQTERSTVAKGLADELERRLPRIRIRVAERVPGLTIKRGATVLDEAVLDTEIPVDLGSHALQVEAPGRKPWSREVKVEREATLVDVVVPALERADDAVAGPPPKKPPRPVESSTPTIAGWAMFGGGAAIAVVGGVLGGLTLGDVSDAEDDPTLCPQRKCSPQGLEVIDSAEQKGIAATVLLAAGGALAATGIVLVLLPSGSSDSKDAALQLRLTGTSWGLQGSF